MTRIDQALRRARDVEEVRADAPAATATTPGDTLTYDPAAFSVEQPRRSEGRGSERRQVERAVAPGSLSPFTRVVASTPASQNGRTEAERLITAIDQADPTLDQFRSLAATLHHAQQDREIATLTVTSAASGEGKTLVSANLALTLSQSYNRRVLLIDADLRRPGLHQYFPVPSDAGLSGALGAIRDGAAVAVHEITPRLALLPAGRSLRDPVSLFSLEAMHRLVAAAAESFDWVILDAPPVGMLPDASLLSNLTDAVLLVVQAGRVRYQLVQRTVESLGADRIFGVVLNRVPERDLVSSFGREYYTPYRE
jgi:capsular exopolysaccharide synthesis family protein